jgi:hypothetical protein
MMAKLDAPEKSKTRRFDHRNISGPEGKTCHEVEVLEKNERPRTKTPPHPVITRPASGKVVPALDSGA